MKKWIIFSVLVIIFINQEGKAMEPVYPFLEKDGSPGKIHNLTPEDMTLHPNESFWYTESYFFIAYLESGQVAYLNLIISNMGLKKNQPALTLTIITPERERLSTERDFPPDLLILSEDRFAIRIGDNFLAGDDKNLSLEIKQAGLGMELGFSSPVPGFKLGEGCAYFGKDKNIYYCINYPAPRARVSGYIFYKDKKVPASGWGYVDHCWFNANTVEFEQQWHNFKFFSPEKNLIITSFEATEKYGNKLVGIASLLDDRGIILATTELKVNEFNHEFEPTGKKSYPRRILFEFKSPQGSGRIDFNSSNLIEKMDVLEKLNKGAGEKALKWMIQKFIAKPFYYRSVGPAELELNLKSEHSKISGNASCEVIFIK